MGSTSSSPSEGLSRALKTVVVDFVARLGGQGGMPLTVSGYALGLKEAGSQSPRVLAFKRRCGNYS